LKLNRAQPTFVGAMESVLLGGQPLAEKLDHPLAGVVGRVAGRFADLKGQHRMRHPAKPVLIARRRVDLDDLEGVAEGLAQRGEALGRRCEVAGEPQPIAQRPPLLVRSTTTFSSSSDNPGSRRWAGVIGNGSAGWL